MQGKGPMQASDVVDATGLQARYVEEWLKGMTGLAGYLEYDNDAGTYSAPEETAFFRFRGHRSLHGWAVRFCAALLGVAPKVADAFRTGGGVRFEEFGPECVVALDMINSGQYDNRFGSYWLGKLPDVVRRLEGGGRVLDFGCGVGRVGAAIAKAFPKCEVVGLDPDPETIKQARAAATAAGLGERIRFIANAAGERKKAKALTSSPPAIASTTSPPQARHWESCVIS